MPVPGGARQALPWGSLTEVREDDKRRREPFWKAVAGIMALALISSFVLLMRSR